MKGKNISYPMGVAQGRFQIIHRGHMEYLLEAKKRCKFLYIGMIDMDPSCVEKRLKDYAVEKDTSKEPYRSYVQEGYCFTFSERALMIQDALIENGIKAEDFMVVPCPIRRPGLIKYYIPLEAMFLITVYDDWGRRKMELLKSIGARVEILLERDMASRFTTGTEVRRRIVEMEDWEGLVPKAVAKIIKGNNLAEKLRNCEK